MNKNMDTIRAAAKNGRTVSFNYHGETRNVKLELFTEKTGKVNAYVTGWDTDRDDYRRFSAEPIQNFTVV